MFTVIVRSTSHYSDDATCARRPYQSAWVRAHGRDQDTSNQAQAEALASRINGWSPDRGQFCTHFEARVVSDARDTFKPAPLGMRVRLEDRGIILVRPGPAGRIQ